MADDRDKQSMGTKRELTASSSVVNSSLTVVSGGPFWFSPLKPMNPVAPDSIKGRVFDFASGYNLNNRPRAYESVSFDMLRAFADACDILRLVIETRKDQMARRPWNIVPRHEEEKDSEQLLARCKQIKEFLRRPDRENFWSDWLRLLLEDLFVIDAPSIYRRRTYGGDLYSLEVIDGATVKRVIDEWGRTPIPPDPAYQQILKGLPALEYTTQELLYRPRNIRTHKVYGFSPVEQIIMTIQVAISRQTWQLQSYTEGNIPEALIGTPNEWTPDQIAAFQKYFDSMLEGNTGQRRHAKFVPGEIAKGYVATKPAELFGAADEWLARVVCYCFNVSPQPFVNMMNRATAETAQETAVAEGLAPIENWVKGVMDTILIDDFGEGDLEFRWQEEDELDPNIKSQIIDREASSGLLTINEARAESGRDPFDHPDANRPMFKTASGWVPIFLTEEEKKKKEAMEALAAGAVPGGEEGDGGASPPGDTSGPPGAPSASDGAPAATETASEDEGDEEDEEDIEKFDEGKVRRYPKGSEKGGQFAPKSGAHDRHSDVHPEIRKVMTDEEIDELKELIKNKASQEEILDAMEPIYRSQGTYPETMTPGPDGNPPDGFFENRVYNLKSGNGEVRQAGIGETLDYLSNYADGYAGDDGPLSEKQAFIILGPSAAGKSGIAERLSLMTRSSIVDSDDAKKVIPEFREGLGANAVHEESSFMGRLVEHEKLSKGTNIILPLVGGAPGGVMKRIDRLHAAGYKVHLSEAVVSVDEATRRMAGRSLSTARAIGRDYVMSVGDKPTQTYEALKGAADGFFRIDANGAKGQERILEASNTIFAAGEPLLRKGHGGRGELCDHGGRGEVRSPLRKSEAQAVREAGRDDQRPFVDGALTSEIGEEFDWDRPDIQKADLSLASALSSMFKRLRKSVIRQVKSWEPPVSKAEVPPEWQDFIDNLDLRIWTEVEEDFTEVLTPVFRKAGSSALARLGAAVAEGVAVGLVDRVSDRAVEWATKHAAERVGLSDDPEYSLSESTRRMVGRTIVQGLLDNIGMPAIADALEQSYAFSPERALVIASTEVTSANSMGALAGYEVAQELGFTVKKSWLVKEDCCPICEGNAEQGPIPLDEAFSSGDMAPGAHPHCRCVLVPHPEEPVRKADFDESKVKRKPKGQSGGGQFTSEKSASEMLSEQAEMYQKLDPRLGVKEKWLLEEGEEHTEILDVPDDMIGVKKHCYMNAFKAVFNGAVDADEWAYTEGVVFLPNFPFPIDHAWLSNKAGQVMDVTLVNNKDMKYYGVPFNQEFVAKKTLKNGHYGLFSDGVRMDPSIVGVPAGSTRAWPKMAKFDESKVNRVPAGNPNGGQFTSIETYIGDDPYRNSTGINGKLRSGEKLTDEEQKIVDDIDQMFETHGTTLERDEIVYRGYDRAMASGPINHLSEHPHFISVSRLYNVAHEFADNSDDGEVIEIRIPKGTRVLRTRPFQMEGMRYQEEILLPRGGRFKPSKVRETLDPNRGGTIPRYNYVAPKPIRKADFDESKVNRHPKGSDKGGQFAPESVQSAEERVNKEFQIPVNPYLFEKLHNEYGIDPTEFKAALEKGIPEDLRGGVWLFSLHEAQDGINAQIFYQKKDDGGRELIVMKRSLILRPGQKPWVYHDLFGMGDGVQAKGIGKSVLSSSMDYYEKIGASRIEVGANIDIGGYAWAKYGFVPDDESWKYFKEWQFQKFPEKELRYKDRDLVKAGAYSYLKYATNVDNPKAIWTVADSVVGKEELTHTAWHGILRLDDVEAMERFNHYTGRKKS